MRLIAVVLLIAKFSAPLKAYGWGWDAHRLICAVAEQRLTPKASRMVAQLVQEGADLKGGVVSFVESCLWADNVRYSTRKDTFEQHFMNVPDDARRIDLRRDCEAINCIAVGVQRALTYLTREPTGDREVTRRAAALRYLGHYIADLHQPLHVSNASDWGGNKINVVWYGKETNLHAVWDYEMLDTMGVTHPKSLSFVSSITAEDPGGTVLDWMNESLALARSHSYVNHNGKEIRPGETLGDEYLNRNKPIVLERLALAAERLASLLNAIAEGETPAAFSLDVTE